MLVSVEHQDNTGGIRLSRREQHHTVSEPFSGRVMSRNPDETDVAGLLGVSTAHVAFSTDSTNCSIGSNLTLIRTRAEQGIPESVESIARAEELARSIELVPVECSR